MSFFDKIFSPVKPKTEFPINSVQYFNTHTLPYSKRCEELNLIYNGVKNGEITELDLVGIQSLCFYGIPDELRSFYWKILIGYLPTNCENWDAHLADERAQYHEFYGQFIPECYQKGNEEEFIVKRDFLTARREEDKADFTLFNEINKDVHRTFPNFHFFQLGFDEDEQDSINPHSASLRRILYIWSRLNPGISYVQGMNEVVGPIYYLFATHSETMEFAEEDTFGCFTILMGEIMNNFCKTLDSSEVGVEGKIFFLNDLLKAKDCEIWRDLEEKGLDPRFYSFRWITLLLSQEFELPDVYRLWDSFFSDPNRFEYLTYVCCSMVIYLKPEILQLDFGETLKLLQHYPPIDLEDILTLANQLYDPKYGVRSPLDDINGHVSKFLSGLEFPF